MPPPNEMFAILQDLFERHGLLLVGFAAFIEGVVLINFYFPGSAVILVGVIVAHGNPLLATKTVAITVLSFFVAACLNYAIGYFGMHEVIVR